MEIAVYISWAILAASIGYTLVASACVIMFEGKCAKPLPRPSEWPTVTLFKPLHGLDYELEENLKSFCAQDYPAYQVIFGVSSPQDPAIPVVRTLLASFPDLDAEIVIDERINGGNPKVSNLINMDKVAKNDVLIISDSDMRVKPDYIQKVVSGFSAPDTGVVTCLYRGTSAPGFASQLGAMFINQWFAPSALIPATFGEMSNCFGATMAIPRKVLTEIGGLKALASNLADDHTMGLLARKHGHKITLGTVVVENIVEEKDLKALILHELRWARTIRSVAPLGFASTFLTDTFPIGLVVSFLMYLAGWDLGWALLPAGIAIGARLVLHGSTIGIFSSRNPSDSWIFPIRDLLSFFVRLICYTGKTVSWRSSHLSVGSGGEID